MIAVLGVLVGGVVGGIPGGILGAVLPVIIEGIRYNQSFQCFILFGDKYANDQLLSRLKNPNFLEYANNRRQKAGCVESGTQTAAQPTPQPTTAPTLIGEPNWILITSFSALNIDSSRECLLLSSTDRQNIPIFQNGTSLSSAIPYKYNYHNYFKRPTMSEEKSGNLNGQFNPNGAFRLTMPLEEGKTLTITSINSKGQVCFDERGQVVSIDGSYYAEGCRVPYGSTDKAQFIRKSKGVIDSCKPL